MRYIKSFLVACLALLVFCDAHADDSGDTARAAVRRGAQSATTSQTTEQSTRRTSSSKDTTATNRTNTRTGTEVSARTVTTSPSQSASPRTPAPGISTRQSPQTTRTHTVQSRTAYPTKSRTTVVAPKQPASARTATARTSLLNRFGLGAAPTARTGTPGGRVARTAANTTQRVTQNYKTCRETFYSCMDEFCANKDTQLRRCACSSRHNEFNAVKKRLADVSDKMLDFNERLLTVNMDKEDVLAMTRATEGEIAFAQEDKSESKKMLNEIAKKLNTSFDDSNFDRKLSAISLSLNADSAFDTIDSMMGANTTTKIGPELYSAALPVCREMSQEICTEEELALAESGYQMTIEQDCSTVSKSYQTQMDKARTQINEESALLDMSRLDVHQRRNSDDLLTCKSKMLDMLTDPSVCGNDMGKCLDITGQYIDPTTGEAFLTANLADLSTLIVRPSGNQTWTGVPGNKKFVTFLNTKREFLAPAMENCQDISNNVWNAFIEDALGQIKLAQDKKLETVRQSCTTLTAECLTGTFESITEFDARALSTFGVTADRTVNTMCADIKNACSALMESTNITSWSNGMTAIQNAKTYETILQTCREVGKACIIQACKSISGNFGLCESLTTSINRKSILNRTACWQDVLNCVGDAGDETITAIINQLTGTEYNNNYFYETMYGITNPTITNQNSVCNNNNCIYDLCYTDCTNPNNYDTPECLKCRIAERIWGNCELTPIVETNVNATHNFIKKPVNDIDTLLYWFAKNTGTENNSSGCFDSSCVAGQIAIYVNNATQCYDTDYLVQDSAHEYCLPNDANHTYMYTVYTSHTNCCNTGLYDNFDNCCYNTDATPVAHTDAYGNNSAITNSNTNLCSVGNSPMQFIVSWPQNNPNYNLFCIGNITYQAESQNDFYTDCDDTWVIVDSSGHYFVTPTNETEFDATNSDSYISYKQNSQPSICRYTNNNWGTCTTPSKWTVSY